MRIYCNEPEKMDLGNTVKISTKICYETSLIVVLNNNTIEKWKLNGLKLDTRWRTPISCEGNESIGRIGMTSQYYALMINKVDGYHFELRNSTMSRIGSVKTNDYLTYYLVSLPNESGWLFYDRFQNKNYSYVIDNQLNIHEQKYLSTVKVKDIVVQGNTVIIHYDGQANDGSETNQGRIEYYEWK